MLRMFELLRRVVAGDGAAWRELWRRVEPRLWRLSGRPQLTGNLCRRDEERHDIVVAVMARLCNDDFRRVRTFLADATAAGGVEDADEEERRFAGWLTVVASRVAIDYVRAHAEYHDVRRSDSQGRRWVSLCAFDATGVESAARELDPERATLARRLVARARMLLAPAQLEALSLWLEGDSFERIAEQVAAGSPESAQRLVRSGLRRLRDSVAARDHESEREPALCGAFAPAEVLQ